MNFKKYKKLLRKYLRSHRFLSGLLIFFTVFLGSILVIVVFGVDQKILNTPFSGEVIANNGEKISGADVYFQNQQTFTNDEGRFEFSDVDFGSHEIKINKNGYLEKSQVVKIGRSGNFETFMLQTQEFGELSLVFDYGDVAPQEFKVALGGQEFNVEETEKNLVANTGKLLISEYLLEIISPEFVDISQSIEITPGKDVMEIKLVPAGDIVGEVEDFLTHESIHDADIEFQNKPINQKFLNKNQIEIKDLIIDEDVSLVLKKKDYLDKEIVLKIKRGINSLGKVYLVEKQIVVFENDGALVETNIDGSEIHEITKGAIGCTIREKSEVLLYHCQDSVIILKKENEKYKILKKYNINNTKVDALNNGNIVLVNGGKVTEVAINNDTEIIYQQTEPINSVVTDGGGIYISDSSGVYKVIKLDKTKSKIVGGSFFLQDATSDGFKLLAYSTTEGNNMWIINTQKRVVDKVNFLPGKFFEAKFINNSEIYYLENNNLYLHRIGEKELLVFENAIKAWIYPNSQLLLVFDGEEFVISDHKIGKFRKIDLDQ